MLGALIRRKIATAGLSREEIALESTVFSLSAQVPRPSERRTDGRQLALLPAARLIGEHGECLCRVRNISAGGLMAETPTPPPVDTPVEIELVAGQRIPGKVVWTRRASVGVKFEKDVDLRELLASRKQRDGYRARPPRLDVSCGGTVRIGGLYHQVEVQDISLGGLKVELAEWQAPGKPVVVTVESLRPIKGSIAWSKGGKTGIVFDKPLKFEELAEWMGKRLEVASLKAGAWSGPERH